MTAHLGVDYSFSRPSITAMKRQGVTAVGRYLTGPGKALTTGEAAALRKAGLDIWVVYEAQATNARGNHTAGQRDAQTAITAAHALGCPKGMCLYFAVDFDGTGPQVQAYAQGWTETVHAAGYRSGVYAGIGPIDYLCSRKIIDLGWQTAAWSNGRISPHAAIYQGRVWTDSTRYSISGASVDWNELRSSDYGGWRKPVPPKPTPPPTLKRGSKGPAVTQLKKLLRAHGYRFVLLSTDRYGAGCTRAVNLIKKRHGWPQDGVCGRRVWAALTSKKK